MGQGRMVSFDVKATILALLVLSTSGCLESTQDSGRASFSSVGCSSANDPVAPPVPPMPTAFTLSQPGEKLDSGLRRLLRLRRRAPVSARGMLPFARSSYPETAFATRDVDTVPAGMEFVAVVDHQCTFDHRYPLQPRLGEASTISAAVMSPEIEVVQRARHHKIRAHIWNSPSGMSIHALGDLVDTDPCLLSLSPETKLYRTDVIPNDTFFTSLAHLYAIRAPLAYDTFYNSTTGISSEVVVAVIDDGVQVTHPDLSPNMWVNTGEISGNGIDDDGNGFVDDVYGYNFSSAVGSPDPEGTASHGTHVAGLAAARAGNNLGVAGVIGTNVKIMALNVFGTWPSASIASIINALNYASAMGADVINLSLGGGGQSASLRTALQNAVANGAVVLAAAGNDAAELTEDFVPAGYAKGLSGMLAVTSLDADDSSISSFSNWSSTLVEIAAPGSSTADGGLLSTLPSSTYGYKQGTSMATPVVSGAAALAISLIRSRGSGVTPATLETLLLSSATQQAGLDGYVSGCRALDLKSLSDVLDTSY